MRIQPTERSQAVVRERQLVDVLTNRHAEVQRVANLRQDAAGQLSQLAPHRVSRCSSDEGDAHLLFEAHREQTPAVWLERMTDGLRQQENVHQPAADPVQVAE